MLPHKYLIDFGASAQSGSVPTGALVNGSVSSRIPSIYEYFPLPLGNSVHIRVIRILSDVEPTHTGNIVCEFRILDVNKGQLYNVDTASNVPGKVEYAALSYTWGDEIADQAVEINGQVVSIRRNLREFLVRARLDAQLEHYKYYWIDALCIDQSHVRERNHQVSLMGHIYSQAQVVLVWIGHISSRSENALKKSRVTIYGGRPLLVEAEDVEELSEFLCARYWSRAWIVQEFVLAKEIIVLYGRSEMDEKDLFWLLREIHSGHLSHELKKSMAIKIALSREEWHRRALRRFEERASHAWSPRDSSSVADLSNELWLDGGEVALLLDRFGHDLQCTDPRDRVYSLLSLLSDSTRKCLSIYPDYSKSPVELFSSLLDSFEPISPSEHVKQLSNMVAVVQQMLGLLDDDVAQRRADETRARIEAASRIFEKRQALRFEEFVNWD